MTTSKLDRSTFAVATPVALAIACSGCLGVGREDSGTPIHQLQVDGAWYQPQGDALFLSLNEDISLSPQLLAALDSGAAATTESGAAVAVVVKDMGQSEGGAFRIGVVFDAGAIGPDDSYVRVTLPTSNDFSCTRGTRALVPCEFFGESVTAPRLRKVSYRSSGEVLLEFGVALDLALAASKVHVLADGVPCAQAAIESETPDLVTVSCPKFLGQSSSIKVAIDQGLTSSTGIPFRTLQGELGLDYTAVLAEGDVQTCADCAIEFYTAL